MNEQQGSQIGTIGSGIIPGSGVQGTGHINQGTGHNNQGAGHNNQGTVGQINQSGPPYPPCSSGLTCVHTSECNLYTGFIGEQVPTYENQPFVQYNVSFLNLN